MSRKVNVHYHTGESKQIKVKGQTRQELNQKWLDKKTTNARYTDNMRTGLSVFMLIVAILIGIAVIRMFAGYEAISFTTLLETLSNAPNIQMSLSSSMQLVHIGGEWEILDGIRRFINSLGSMFGISIWCAQGLFQCILYFGYFIGFIFVG